MKISCEARDEGIKCGKEVRFKIIDIVCGQYERTSGFWVCEECLKCFINQNEEEPHYIILKENEEKK